MLLNPTESIRYYTESNRSQQISSSVLRIQKVLLYSPPISYRIQQVSHGIIQNPIDFLPQHATDILQNPPPHSSLRSCIQRNGPYPWHPNRNLQNSAECCRILQNTHRIPQNPTEYTQDPTEYTQPYRIPQHPIAYTQKPTKYTRNPTE